MDPAAHSKLEPPSPASIPQTSRSLAGERPLATLEQLSRLSAAWLLLEDLGYSLTQFFSGF